MPGWLTGFLSVTSILFLNTDQAKALPTFAQWIENPLGLSSVVCLNDEENWHLTKTNNKEKIKRAGKITGLQTVLLN